jgi:pimeloyl-ACP methyl ester carboxylesterase
VNQPPEPSLVPSLVPSTDDVELALWDLGGAGPPLLAVHATMFCGHIWAPVAPHLTTYHWWAPDLRAHGHSRTPPAADLSWPAMAADVLATVDHLGLRDVRAVGHSMGAAALLLAEMARPGTFSTLWLYDPVVRPSPQPGEAVPDSVLADGARRRRSTFPTRQAAFDNYAAKPPLDTATPEALWAYVEWGFEELADGSVRLRCPPEVESTIYRYGAIHGAFERLGEVGCPATVVHGRLEEDRPSRWSAEVVAQLPRGIEEMHPELSHFGPLEDPPGMARSIAGALAR